jgi:chromate transporter
MSAASAAAMQGDGLGSPSFREALGVWAKIGFINFGGPAGQIALMHRILVEEKRWIDEARFLHALNFCMLLPGPEATQLAAYVGRLLHGARGGVAAGVLFVLPGFFVLLALSIAYYVAADLPAVGGALFGLKAAVLAIVAEALVRVGRRALKRHFDPAIGLAAFAAIAFFDVPFPLIVAGAAFVGLVYARSGSAPPVPKRRQTATAARTAPLRESLRAVVVWGAIWFLPLSGLAAAFGADHVFLRLGVFFSEAAVVTFGGAYAVLAYVAQQAVEVHGWLAPGEMITGLGLAETTPGPLILVLVFVGFLAGARGAAGLEPLAGGTIGALVTLWVTFVPSFLFIFAGAPFVERLRENRAVAEALAAVTAAVVGVVANLALWFGLHVLFGAVGEAHVGPVSLPLPDATTFDPAAALIALAAALALLRFHVGVVPVLLGAAAAGIIVVAL